MYTPPTLLPVPTAVLPVIVQLVAPAKKAVYAERTRRRPRCWSQRSVARDLAVGQHHLAVAAVHAAACAGWPNGPVARDRAMVSAARPSRSVRHPQVATLPKIVQLVSAALDES